MYLPSLMTDFSQCLRQMVNAFIRQTGLRWHHCVRHLEYKRLARAIQKQVGALGISRRKMCAFSGDVLRERYKFVQEFTLMVHWANHSLHAVG